MSRESVHSKLGTGNFLKHTFTQDSLNLFHESIEKSVIELAAEQMLLGDFMRAKSFAI